MKFLFSHRSKKQPEQHKEKTVLFVCVESAGRSQMAEGRPIEKIRKIRDDIER